MEFDNLAPFDVTLYDLDKETVLRTIPHSGRTAEVTTPGQMKFALEDGTRCLSRPLFDGVKNITLPLVRPTIVTIVVAIWLETHGHSTEFVYVPATDPEHAVRGESGATVGTTALIHWGVVC